MPSSSSSSSDPFAPRVAVGAKENLGAVVVVEEDVGDAATVPPDPNADAVAPAPKTDLPGTAAALPPPPPNAPNPPLVGFAAPNAANPPDEGVVVAPPPKAGADPNADPDPNGEALGVVPAAAAPNPPAPLVVLEATDPKAENPPEDGTAANADPAAGVVAAALDTAGLPPNGELVAADEPNAPNPLPSAGVVPNPEVEPKVGVDDEGVVEAPKAVEPNADTGGLDDDAALDPNAGGVDAAPKAEGAAKAPNAVGFDAGAGDGFAST